MDTREFLERVLPLQGGYFGASIAPGCELSQSFQLATIDKLLIYIGNRHRARENIFFATGTYEGSRTRAAVTGKKSLYLDMDCGGSHKGFETKRDAVLALKKFCDDSSFPMPSIIVDSGGGVHAYWPLTEVLDVKTWEVLATALKAACEQYGFAADHAITSDAARILRVPGTTNWKDANKPTPCRIIYESTKNFTVEELQGYLVVTAPSNPAAILRGIADESALGKGIQYATQTYRVADIVDKCGVLRHSLAIGGRDQPGTLWFKVLHLLAFTEDGHAYIHEFSNQHPEYDASATERRYAYAVSKKESHGPTLCTTFEQFLPSKCAGCPFRGKIKTPLVLGRTEESYLPPSYRAAEEGIYKVTKYDDKGQPQDWTLVIPYRLSKVEEYENARGARDIRFLATDKGGAYPITIPAIQFPAEGKEFVQSLWEQHLRVSNPQANEIRHVMTPWLRKMAQVKKATQISVTGLGWANIDGQVGFTTGSKIFLANGSVQETTGLDRSLCREYDVRGERDAWDDCATKLTGDNCHPITAAILSAFAAPLVHFTGISGVMFSLHSAESGTGKSSALRIAQSVWGDPKRGVNALDDTSLSVVKKMGFLNNLPAYWDEVRMRDEVQKFVKTVFQLGQGKERSRLNSGAKMQEMGTWSTMITVATNERILDHIDHVISNTNAGRLRVFEVSVPQRPLVDTTMPFLLKELDKNFGHAGAQYAEWLSKNHEQVKALVQKMQQHVTAELGASNDERFWIALVAILMVAASFVNKLGYFQVDLDGFKKWLHNEFYRQRAAARGVYTTHDNRAVAAIVQFLDHYRDQIVVADHVAGGAVHVQPISKEIVALKARHDKKVLIKKVNFDRWVYDTFKDSPADILNSLVKTGAAKVIKASVTAGIANTIGAKVIVIELDLSSPIMAPLVGDDT